MGWAGARLPELPLLRVCMESSQGVLVLSGSLGPLQVPVPSWGFGCRTRGVLLGCSHCPGGGGGVGRGEICLHHRLAAFTPRDWLPVPQSPGGRGPSPSPRGSLTGVPRQGS